MQSDRYNIVILDMNMASQEFKEFHKKSTRKQIDNIAERIDQLCLDLISKNEKESKWVFSWCEYGITSPDSIYVSNEDKQYLKQKMEALSRTYPQITIIAGTMAVKRHFDNTSFNKNLNKVETIEDRLKRIESYYIHHEWMSKDEQRKRTFSESSDEISKNLRKIQKLRQSNATEIDVVKNESFIFENGKCIKRTKAAAWYEIKSEGKKVENTIFQPEKQLQLHAENRCFVEICREHFFGFIKNLCKKNHFEKPLIHLVISSGMKVLFDKIYGEYFILVDSKYKPIFIIDKEKTEEEISKLPIRLYQNNLLDEKDIVLEKQIKPFYPPQLKILDKIEMLYEEVLKLSEEDEKQIEFKQLKLGLIDSLREQFSYAIATNQDNLDFWNDFYFGSVCQTILKKEEHLTNLSGLYKPTLSPTLSSILNEIKNLESKPLMLVKPPKFSH